jgi:hypothetical protein
MFEMRRPATVASGALIQVIDPDGRLIAELTIAVFVSHNSVLSDLDNAELAQAEKDAKSVRPLPPRDPTTGRFISVKADGVEDGSFGETASDRFRQADLGRRLMGASREIRLTDEVSDEMVDGDELALSPEDILIAREEEEIDPEDEEDFEGDGDDTEYFVDLLWAEHERAAWDGTDEDADNESDDDLVDSTDSFCDRPTVNRSDKCGTRGRPSPMVAARARRKLLVSRMRRARRNARSWLTRPDWSDKASARLEAEELAELEAKMEAARAEWDDMIEADLVFECEVYENALSRDWADLIEEREDANRLKVKAA